MTGIVKGIAKVGKKIVKGVKSAYKKITSTTLGKVLLAGAAIWLGGAALGKWAIPNGVPFASKINGAFVGGGGAATTAGTAATAAPAATTSAAASNAAAAASMPTGIETLTVTAPAAAGPSLGSTAGAIGATTAAAAPMTAPVAQPPVPKMQPVDLSGVQGTAEQQAASQASKGLISKLMTPVNKMATWAGNNPLPAAMLVSGVGSALSPDAIDVAEAQAKQEEQNRKRWQENLNVGDINLGFTPTKQPLQYATGGPVFDPRTGAINRVRRA